jgi:GR25 family glycosyltransferase involved in LPS biosynthesis
LVEIPIYVLCLRELPDRTERVAKHLAERGLEWKPFFGFPGVSMGLSTSIPYRTDGHTEKPCPQCGNETAYRTNPGTVACTLSHLALLKHIVAAGHKHALIFENDVELSPDFVAKFDKFYRQLPTDWDLVYLDYDHGYASQLKIHSEGVALCEGSMLTDAYMVSARAARFLDEHCQQAWRPIDVSFMVEARGRLKTYFASPKLASQLTATGKMAGSLHFDAAKFTEPAKEAERLEMQDVGGMWDWRTV